MSTPAESTPTDTRPGEVRTYRGRTVEELIPRIRAELGPGAMILRERQGLTGGVGGFFAKRCVEIDAQAPPRLSIYADDDLADDAGAADPAAPADPATPSAVARSASTREITMPSHPMPEATMPSNPTPEATQPSNSMPEATMPSNPTPEATMPNAPMPDDTRPRIATPEAPAPNAAAAEEAPVPSAGRPHVSRPGTAAPSPAAPNPRPTPDPFAALLARWEQVAANNLFDPDVTPDPFGSATPAMPEATQAAAPQPAAEATQAAAPQPAADAVQAEPVSEPQPVVATTPDIGFIAFDELEPEVEPTAQSVSIPMDVAPADTAASAVFRPRPLQPEQADDPSASAPAAEPAPETSVAADAAVTPDMAVTPDAPITPDASITPDAAVATTAPSDAGNGSTEEAIGQTRLRRRLMERGLSAPLAEKLVADAAEAAGSQAEPMLVANAQAELTAMLPQPEPLPVDGGVIAIVGPSGSGKTRAVAALAAAYARQGYGVTVAQLRGTRRDDELSELLQEEEVDLITPMTIRATVREVEAAREDLVILDTPATRVGDSWGLESLTKTLSRFRPDGVLLCTPATFTRQALAKLVEHHASLQIDGLVATHHDQAGTLGTVVELAIETRIPLGHVHSGLDVAAAISSVDPGALAADLVR